MVGILAMLGVGNQCSPNPNMIDNTRHTGNLSIPTETKSPSKEMSQELQSRYETMRLALKGELAKLGMTGLDESPAGPDTELRVLVGLGLGHPRCFIWIKRGSQQEAFYVAPKVTGNKAITDEKGKFVIARTALAAPASGWDEFNSFLKHQGIDSQIKLSLDEKQTSDPDQEVILMELKSGSDYSMIFFPAGTESGDGKRAWSVCRKIEEEFGIKMGCEQALAAP